ncbi:MAG: hypothetical protein ABID04_00260 [Patescibacteria group bacterium]
MLDGIKKTISRLFEPDTVQVAGATAKWQKVNQLKAGMKIAVPAENQEKAGVNWDEIVEIRHIGQEQVWDIEVEGTHNFVANGIIAHNTYLSQDLTVAGNDIYGSDVYSRITLGSTVSVGVGTTAAGGSLAVGNIDDIVGLSASETMFSLNRWDNSYTANNRVGMDLKVKEGGGPDTTYYAGFVQAAISDKTNKYGKLFLGAYSNGTAVDGITIDRSGNVGIGTTGPSEKLHIKGRMIIEEADSTDTVIKLFDSGDDGLIDLYANNSVTTRIFANGDSYFNGGDLAIGAADSGTAKLYVNGNVGIGTTSPNSNLDIYYSYGGSNVPFRINDQSGKGIYVSDENSINFDYGVNSNSIGYINGRGYINGTAQFRDLAIQDGKDHDIAYFDGSTGYVGIGTTNPGYKLDVSDYIIDGYVAQITNTTTSYEEFSHILLLRENHITSSKNYFVGFSHNGTIGGKIQGGGSSNTVAYTTSGADYAEYFGVGDLANKPQVGDLVSIDSKTNNSVIKSTTSLATMGVISSSPGFIGKDSICRENDQKCSTDYENNNVLVGIVGQILTKISTGNGPIKTGDPLTSSQLPGVAVKATGAGPIVGRALENYSETDPNSIGTIMVYVNPSWYDPNIHLTDSGDLTIEGSYQYPDTEYTLKDKTGQTIERIGAFGQLVVAKIRAGLIETDQLVANKIVSPQAEINQVSGLETVGGIDRLEFEGENGQTIMTVDQNNGVQIPVLESQSIETDQLLADEATITNLTGNQATFSAIYADEIMTNKGSFGDLIADKIAAVRADLEKIVSGPGIVDPEAPTGSSLLGQISDWTTQASESGVLIENGQLSSEVVLASQLVVQTRATLEEAYINKDLLVGDIVISQGAISTLSDILLIQPSGVGTIDILAGVMTISDDGNVAIRGDLAVGGQISAQSSSFGELLIKNDQLETVASIDASGSAQFNKVSIALDQEAQVATESAEIRTNAAAGKGVITAGTTEVKIYTDKLTADSLSYITPTTDTGNQVLFVKQKTEDYFIVAIRWVTDEDIEFNWWIIN